MCLPQEPILLDAGGFLCQTRGWNKVYLFDWSFLVLMKITLQFNYCNFGFWWCSKSPVWSSSFSASFHHFSYKERPDLQKINLFTLIQYFSQKIRSSTVILFSAPLKSKAVQGSQFCKASIPSVTQCHHTNTSWNTIPLIYKAIKSKNSTFS